ncbi:MAG TPA: sulfotransferase family 2 domain-containing protein [Xanthobacteraceae bacterium]|nr:sulfotransferase family 2 domain-containing protein [Xanthobacteraceae bacterium]
MRLLRPVEVRAKELLWIASAPLTDLFDPAAAEFYGKLISGGYEPDLLLNVLPAHKLLYVALPKAASTRIRQTLARVGGRYILSLKPSRRARYSGPYGPRSMTKSAFFRLAIGADTLRFSFVRNPYARAVSCWADKFRGKPLVPGDPLINAYLAVRRDLAAGLPAGADRSLPFPAFVLFAAAAARRRCDIHVQAQDDILSMPGIRLDHVGKVESFAQDFARVLDHVGASAAVRREALIPMNESRHDAWSAYYTAELADRIYRAYERDFDRFEYPRAMIPEA